ncbi:MAG: hypothetical protein KGR26_08370 [Cyanobacteria bacterium REEB65]|nr:hypothetical protein [Cyanobacteria bacterium REEB65]
MAVAASTKVGPASRPAPAARPPAPRNGVLASLVRQVDQYLKAPATTKPSDDPTSAQLLGYRIWPGAGAPIVSEQQDARLATTGPAQAMLAGLDTKAPWLANLVRGFTRVGGPSLFGVSAIANTLLLEQDWNDPAFKPQTKAALLAGTGFTFAGAATASWAALPIRGALTANRFSGLFGGVAGAIFGAINMIVTLQNKDATPVEKFAAAGGFALGAVATILGTAAVFSIGAPVLVPLATATGIASMAMGGLQYVGAQNKPLNSALADANNAVSGFGRKILGAL